MVSLLEGVAISLEHIYSRQIYRESASNENFLDKNYIKTLIYAL